MQTVYKYELPYPNKYHLNDFIIKVPVCAKFLKLDVQDNKPVIWLIVETENPLENIRFKVILTGEEMPPECSKENYIDSFTINGWFVGHLFKLR